MFGETNERNGVYPAVLDFGSLLKKLFESEEERAFNSVECKDEREKFCADVHTVHCLAQNNDKLGEKCRRRLERVLPSMCKQNILNLGCNGLDYPKLQCLVDNETQLTPQCRDAVKMSKQFLEHKQKLADDAEANKHKEWQCPDKFKALAVGKCCTFGGPVLEELCCGGKAGGWCDPDKYRQCVGELCASSNGIWNSNLDVTMEAQGTPLCCPKESFLTVTTIRLLTIVIIILVGYLIYNLQPVLTIDGFGDFIMKMFIESRKDKKKSSTMDSVSTVKLTQHQTELPDYGAIQVPLSPM